MCRPWTFVAGRRRKVQNASTAAGPALPAATPAKKSGRPPTAWLPRASSFQRCVPSQDRAPRTSAPPSSKPPARLRYASPPRYRTRCTSSPPRWTACPNRNERRGALPLPDGSLAGSNADKGNSIAPGMCSKAYSTGVRTSMITISLASKRSLASCGVRLTRIPLSKASCFGTIRPFQILTDERGEQYPACMACERRPVLLFLLR